MLASLADDGQRAREHYGRACELGHVWSCGLLGWMDLFGDGAPRDVERAARRLEQACAAGDLGACLGLGFSYKEGRGVAQSDGRAHELLGEFCERADAGGGGHLAWLYREGRGVPHDLAKAARIFRDDCERAPLHWGNAWTCAALADMEHDGVGMARDPALAARHYAMAAEKAQRGCDTADAWSCVHLGFLHERGRGVAEDLARAHALDEKACKMGNGTGGAMLGWHHLSGKGAPQDLGQAERYLELGCHKGDSKACQGAADLIASRDAARAAALREQACEDGNGWGCLSLAVALRDGLGIAKDEARARRRGARARELFRAYKRGAADPFDPEQAVDRAGF